MALPATDAFTRADGGLGANWTTIGGLSAPQIASNAVQTNAVGSDSGALWNADSFSADQYSKIVATTVNTATSRLVGAAVRCEPTGVAQTFYAACARGPLGASATLEIRRVVAGVTTTLATGTFTINSGDVIKCTVEGTTVKSYINGVEKQSVTDATTATGSAGIFVFVDTGAASDAVLDTWEAGNGLDAGGGGGAAPTSSGLTLVGVQ